MHSSIWKFKGDSDELAAKYDAMLNGMPSEPMRFHACVKTDDGLLVFDTCPSESVFRDFMADPFFRTIEAAGLPRPDVEDHPVHAVFVNGARTV